jgi:aerobic-type carbon monoxide dehydrogenase small subunit (CoxS/CutS family)
MVEPISFNLNGKPVRPDVDPARMLLWVLRTELGLTGTKYGCGEGFCGTCTVLVDGAPVRSCRTPVKDVRGKAVLTIEGLERDGKLHPLQEAFVKHEAMQCGFCTSGMILTAYALLARNPRPTRQDIVDGLEDNLCRCGTHTRVIRAVQDAAATLARGIFPRASAAEPDPRPESPAAAAKGERR